MTLRFRTMTNFAKMLNDINEIDSKKVATITRQKNTDYFKKLENSKQIDKLYVDTINRVGIVSWQLCNKIHKSARTTHLSRLQRLVKQGKIKKTKTFYHSNEYKSSRNDLHNLWISSVMLDLINKNVECLRDTEIMKDSKYKFSRFAYDDNFVSDLVAIQNNKVEAYEIELTKKSNNEQVKNKIDAYIYAIKNEIFTKVRYITDNTSVKKQIEYFLQYFDCDADIKVIMVSKEKMLIN